MREARISIGDAEFETLGIEGLVSACREAGLREFEELACHGNGAVVEVEVERPIGDRLAALEYVDRWERVSEADGAQAYVIAFTAPGLPDSLAERADGLIGTCDPDVGERGATMTFVGPQATIRDVIEAYANAGVSPELRKLGEYDGPERPLDELTDRQREVIETAYEEGYYEVPREVSTDDVARELDVDPSTVAEHLQRAERNLLARHLSSTR